MIEIKLNNTPYQLPASWNDVTYAKYCDIVTAQTESLSKRLSVYTGIDEATINQMKLKSLNMLADITEFLDSPDDVHDFAMPFESEINIAHESYGKLEQAKQAIQNKPHPIIGAAEVIKIYTGEDINEQPITKAISQVAFFLLSLQRSWKNTSDSETTNQPTMNLKQVLTGLASLAASEQQPH